MPKTSRPVSQADMSETSLQQCSTSLLTITQDRYLSLVDNAKVVSFDVFDTLIHRRTVVPTDVFELVGRRLDKADFRETRIAAEASARRKARPDTFEVSLDEIYQAFPDDYFTDIQTAKDIEIQSEHEFTYANESMRALITRVRSSGKRVIAITDIYLSDEQVQGLLEKNGITVDAIYSSANYRHNNHGKYNGSIFPIVCKEEGIAPHELLHAGDHPGSDVSKALSEGVVAVQTGHPTQFLINHDANFEAIMHEHDCHTTSLIAGTIAKGKISNNSRLDSSVENYGYDFGGPLLVGMITHMLKRCSDLGIDHLVLLARDGCVVRDVLDELRPDNITYRVIPASRRLAVFPTFSSGEFEKISSLFAGQAKLSKRQILAVLRLDHLANDLIDADEVMPVKAAIEQMKPQLVEQAMAEKAALQEYLEPEITMLEQGKKFAWVDVGWALSSPTRLNELLGHDIPGFFIGSHGGANSYEGFEGYLFNRGKPHTLAKVAMRSVEIIELIFADWAPSTAYLKQGANSIEPVHYDKSPAETVRDAHIKEARLGVCQFARDIAPVFAMLDSDDLRRYNRQLWARLCSNPPVATYKLLSPVPHDAMAGTKTWRTISELWLPNWSHATPDRKTFPTSRAYRLAYIRRYLKWHLPPSVWNMLNRIDNVLRKYL